MWCSFHPSECRRKRGLPQRAVFKQAERPVGSDERVLQRCYSSANTEFVAVGLYPIAEPRGIIYDMNEGCTQDPFTTQ
jgi:hypothetical protein